MSSAKTPEKTSTGEPVPREFGAMMVSEWLALPDDVRRRRAKRAYEKFLALKGKVYIELDIDEARGRNR